MPRIARVVAINYPHHVTQRGNYQQTVFTNSADYKFYLERLNEYCSKYKLTILAYCLMPNHVHLVAVPENKDSLARTLNACHMRYAHYFNKKKRLTGHLWQGRFYSCVLDEKHLFASVRYIENNPVRAKLAGIAYQWDWSSAKAHINKRKDILDLGDISKYGAIDNWKQYLSQKEEEEIINQIKRNTLTGRPLGSDTFIKKMEELFNRRLKALPRGRPKKR